MKERKEVEEHSLQAKAGWLAFYYHYVVADDVKMFVLRKPPPPPPLPEATVVIFSRILARYQARHVIHQLDISSLNLWLADKKSHTAGFRIRPADWLA